MNDEKITLSSVLDDAWDGLIDLIKHELDTDDLIAVLVEDGTEIETYLEDGTRTTVYKADNDLIESLVDDLHDLIFETADSHTPIYNADLLQLASDNWELITEAPDLACGGEDPLRLITLNVFEAIETHLFEQIQDFIITVVSPLPDYHDYLFGSDTAVGL